MPKFDENGNEIVEEKVEPTTVEKPEEDKKEEPDVSDLKDLDATTLIGIIKDLRGENASKRVQLKQYKTKIDEIDARDKKSVEDKKKKNGEYEELLSSRDAEIESLKPKADAYDKYFESIVNVAKEKMGKNWKEEFSKLPLDTINSLVDAFSGKTSMEVEVDGANNKKEEVSKVTLTEDQKARALERYPSYPKEKAYEMMRQNIINELKRKEKDKE